MGGGRVCIQWIGSISKPVTGWRPHLRTSLLIEMEVNLKLDRANNILLYTVAEVTRNCERNCDLPATFTAFPTFVSPAP